MELIQSHFSDHCIYDLSDRSKYEIIDIINLYNIIPKLIIFVQHNEFNHDFFKKLAHKANETRYIDFYCLNCDTYYYGNKINDTELLKFKESIKTESFILVVIHYLFDLF